MANSNDSSGKGPAKPVPDTAPKKPSALIDLKATEVDIRDPAAAKSATPSKAPDSAALPTQPPLTGAAKVADAAAKSAMSAAATAAPAKATAGASSTPPKPASTAPTSPPPPTASSSGGGVRGAATHLVAGLAGGLLALLGADTLAPHLGLGSSGSPVATQVSPDIAKRIASLEALANRPASADIAPKLAAAEARLAELEKSSRALAELSQQQSRLASETKALGEKLAQSPAETGADGRLAKLEETLTTLSAAAASDPQRGRIPQLAAITSRLTDLEASVAAQVAALRKGVTQDVESRLGQSTEAAQAARAGTQRLDRELAGIKTEAAQLIQRLDTLKAQADRADVTLRGLREETTSLKTEVGSVREDLGRVARPTDVATALSPLTSKLSLLEQNVQGVVRNEDDRRANVERIVTALELGNLKRTIDRGATFGPELAEVRRVAGPKLDLAVLERYRDKGVPAVAELEREFRKVAFAVIEADSRPADGHWADRLLASAKAVVRVRKTDQAADAQGVEAVVARMEAGLKGGRLADVVNEAGKLSAPSKSAAAPWLEKVEARLAVDRAIATIEQELKSSLGAASQAGKKG